MLRLDLAPGSGDRAALVDDIGRQIEPVGVAGAGQAHGPCLGPATCVGRAAADALARAVVQRDGAAAGPIAGHAGERPRLRMARGGGDARP